MRGELPKVGDTVPAMLTGGEVKAKVEGVRESTLLRKERGDFVPRFTLKKSDAAARL